MPETSMAVPAPTDTALVPVVSDEIDEATALAAITALRKYEIGVAVSGIAPVVMGLLMLLAPAGLVPGAALAAVFAICLGAVPVAFVSLRRAFLAECASLGIARPAAKRLFARVLRAEVKLQKGTSQARDRALAASTSTSLLVSFVVLTVSGCASTASVPATAVSEKDCAACEKMCAVAGEVENDVGAVEACQEKCRADCR